MHKQKQLIEKCSIHVWGKPLGFGYHVHCIHVIQYTPKGRGVKKCVLKPMKLPIYQCTFCQFSLVNIEQHVQHVIPFIENSNIE